MDYKGRLVRLRQAMDRHKLDAVLITHPPNIQYLCGFAGSTGALVMAERVCFFTDGRYTEQALAEVQGSRIKIARKSALAAAAQWLGSSKLRRIGIEAQHLRVAERAVVASAVGKGSKLVDAPPIVEELREVKDQDEIASIRRSCALDRKSTRLNSSH